ncbi:MAG: GAF domain-containing protein [Desulfuromonadaceae bacterium]
MGKGTSRLGITILEDVSALIHQSHDLDETLKNIVTLVAKRMGTEVCSIYLLEEDQETLRLCASKGLSRKAVGKVVMKIGEGLTGLAAEKRQVVSIQEPEKHPRYRYFKETGEERFHSFLGIPLFDRKTPIGVLTIQTKDARKFSAEDISALSTIAFQASSIVINARLLESVRKKEEETNAFARELEKTRQTQRDQERTTPSPGVATLRGSVAYPGLASGPAMSWTTTSCSPTPWRKARSMPTAN